MRWKIPICTLSSVLLFSLAGGAHAQQVSVTAVGLDEDSIQVNFPDFSAAQGCFNGPQVTRYRRVLPGGFVQDDVDSRPVGDVTETYDGLGGGDYYFEVTGCVPNNSGEPDYETGFSNVVTITGPALAAPSMPASISADAVDDTISVSWAASVDAASYQIGVRTQPVDGWVDGTPGDWGNWSNYANLGDTLSRDYPGLSPAVYQYRVRACNVTGCSGGILSEAAIVNAPQFDAGDEYYFPDAKIRAIWTSPEGCLVLFEDLPNACETKFSNAHALIQFENPNHEKMYSQVFLANAMGKKIDVWYDDNGDCSSLNSLMTIGRIEIQGDVLTLGENGND